MHTVVNGGAVVEECLLNSNGGRDISLNAINGSINSNESTSPPKIPPTHFDDATAADSEGSNDTLK